MFWKKLSLLITSREGKIIFGDTTFEQAWREYGIEYEKLLKEYNRR